MKVAMFHLMPYRDLPDDFEKKHKSAWFTFPYKGNADPKKVSAYFNQTLDELAYGAQMGFDGVCTNEHHQNAYGFMVNPNMMGSILARLTRGTKTAIIQLGETAVFLNPPIRVAEEYAMLDHISEGRMIAGFPVGLGGDFSYSYGGAPMEHRARYREAVALIKKAWTASEPFPWNGKYYQLPNVNIWPMPRQDPHPPMWVPGNASPSTWDYVVENDCAYCYLTYFGAKGAGTIVNGYWKKVEEAGRDRNPYRMCYLIPVGVSETDESAQREYGRHLEYFYHKLLHVPETLFIPPGHMTHQSTKFLVTKRPFPPFDSLKDRTFADFDREEYAVVGSAATVRERLTDIVKRLRVGNLMILPQFGSMPHEQAMQNIERIAKGVLPALKPIWEDEGWVNHWWPKACQDDAARSAAA